MNACELNAILTALTNHFYTTLSERDFFRLSIFLSQLSKMMITMELLRDICHAEKEKKDKA